MHINFNYSSRWRLSFSRDSKGTQLKFLKVIKLTIIVSLIGNATIAFRVPYGDSERTQKNFDVHGVVEMLKNKIVILAESA